MKELQRSLLPKEVVLPVLKNGARILPIAAILVTSALSGGGETENNNNPQDPISPVSAAPATETKNSPAIEKEQPKSLEQQAEAAALDYFLGLLNSSQSVTNKDLSGEQFKLTSRILKGEELTNKELTGFPGKDIVEGKPAESHPLSILWQFSRIKPDRTSNLNYGRGQIKDIKLSATAVDPTEIDKKNGVSSQWNVAMNFNARSQVDVPFFPHGSRSNHPYISEGKYYGTDEEWKIFDYKPDGPWRYPIWRKRGSEFSPMFQIKLKNGEWKTLVVQNAGLNSGLLGVSGQPVYHPFAYTATSEGCGSDSACIEVAVTSK